jgi:hypothetical protein
MAKLGAWPQDIYYSSWMTQRLANRAPEWTKARMWSWSNLQQMLNPTARDLERVNKQLVEERNNIFLSAANIDLIDRLYFVELGIGMEFTVTDQGDGVPVFNVPKVYATIDDTEYELTIAKKNNIDTLYYSSVPSRIEDGEESYAYTEVIPRTEVQDLLTTTPNSIYVKGHLYITIRNNSTWEYRAKDKIYYPKVFIRGVTRKGVELEEAVPLRYNGTFKTINQWESVSEVFVSYLDETADITIETFPFDRDTQLDTSNLVVPASGAESWRFVRLGTKLWGSTLVSEGFTTSSFDIIRKGFDTLDYEYEIELHDSSSQPITLTSAVLKPNTDYIFAIDNANLYVYNTKLPYPDLTVLDSEHVDTKMDLYSDRWIYARDDVVTIKTHILDVSTVPYEVRWHIKDPDGQEYYILSDGTKILTSNTSVNAWISNQNWDSGFWKDIDTEILVNQTGVHVVTLESYYVDANDQSNNTTLTTKFVFYVPVATPEVVLSLPTELQNCTDLGFDSDGKLWFSKTNEILLSNVFYDYFIVDYEMNTVWLRENYSSVRVVI